VNNLERASQLSSLSREIATLITEMTVDPATGRKHTVGMVEKAMGELGFSVNGTKTAKAQALDLIKALGDGSILPVQRVRMRVRITMPSKDGKRVKDKVLALVDEVEEEDTGAEWEAVSCNFGCHVADAQQIVKISPSAFRPISDLVNDESKGKGRVESMGNIGA
jgi:ribosome maturation protein SDO1